MVVGAPGPAHLSWRVLAHTPLRWADIEPLLDKNMNPAAKEKVGIRMDQTFGAQWTQKGLFF